MHSKWEIKKNPKTQTKMKRREVRRAFIWGLQHGVWGFSRFLVVVAAETSSPLNDRMIEAERFHNNYGSCEMRMDFTWLRMLSPHEMNKEEDKASYQRWLKMPIPFQNSSQLWRGIEIYDSIGRRGTIGVQNEFPPFDFFKGSNTVGSWGCV